MNWNSNMEEAPRGHTVKEVRFVAKGKNKGQPYEVDVFKRQLIIITTPCGHVGTSYWIPSQARWCGCSNGETPLAWMPWPEPYCAA